MARGMWGQLPVTVDLLIENADTLSLLSRKITATVTCNEHGTNTDLVSLDLSSWKDA
jgi:hypothetical protein